jgi:hypothetical protein
MTEKSSILKEVYFDAITTIRHYDGQRASFTQLILSALTVLIGFSIISTKPDNAIVFVRALATVGALLSVIGFLVSLKLNDLISRQRLRARLALTELEGGTDEKTIANIDKALDARSAESFLGRISLRTIWSLVFVVYFVANMVLIIVPSFAVANH